MLAVSSSGILCLKKGNGFKHATVASVTWIIKEKLILYGENNILDLIKTLHVCFYEYIVLQWCMCKLLSSHITSRYTAFSELHREAANQTLKSQIKITSFFQAHRQHQYINLSEYHICCFGAWPCCI
jgi:hypothetical protein